MEQLKAITDFPKAVITNDSIEKLLKVVKPGTLAYRYLSGEELPDLEGRSERLQHKWLLTKLSFEQKYQVFEPRYRFDKVRRDKLMVFDLDPKAKKFMELVEAAGGSTLKKYDAMVRSHVGNKVYGAFVFPVLQQVEPVPGLSSYRT